jgi:hypothetical protein
MRRSNRARYKLASHLQVRKSLEIGKTMLRRARSSIDQCEQRTAENTEGSERGCDHEIADAPGSAQSLQHGWIVPTQRKSGYQQQTREDIVGSWLVDQIGRCAMATSVRA